MEKYQLYRTALDALQFLISTDFGPVDVDKKFLSEVAGEFIGHIQILLNVLPE